MFARTSLAALVVAVLAACSSKKPAGTDTPSPPPRDGKSAPLDARLDPTTITIENRRDTPIWVTSSNECRQFPVAITAADGRNVQIGGQAIGCELARAGNCPSFGGCAGPGVWRIEPGKSLDAFWDGNAMTRRELPAGEVGKGCPSSCVDNGQVPDGEYKLTASAWSACTGDDCACAPGAPADACSKPGGLTGAPDLTATAPLLMPGTAAVRVVFQP